MTDTGSLNLDWAHALIAGFVAAGAREAIISPGSRSTPFALAMLRQPGLRCHIAVDERSAAFFALGVAKVQRRPALLLATSGTAPANWLPAIIEASQSGVPLIALSADRPPELHACGANQTVPQVGMFASWVRAGHALGVPYAGFDPGYLHRLAAQTVEQAQWPYPGPVHINQPFREPLLPADPRISNEPAPPVTPPLPKWVLDTRLLSELAKRIAGRPGVIICGETPADPGLAPAVAALARRLACPILAEPLSGLRFGRHDRSHLCVRYNHWLADAGAQAIARPDWIIRIGAFPVTRHLQNFVAAAAATHIVFDPWPRWSDPPRRVTHLVRGEPADLCAALAKQLSSPAPTGWLDAFLAEERRSATGAEASHITIVVDEMPDGGALFVGNSLAIRQLDASSGISDKTLYCHANRGASGIDGNISTAAGIALAHGRTVALLGDLTCQHDLGGLALARGRDLVIVMINNHGGGIFDHLPQRALPEFEQGWRTPQAVDFGHAAKAFGITHTRVDALDTLRLALRDALLAGGPHLIELQQH
ncbi:MAG: 2-succinyl-5-enolpyruvyl-6-hydroxy-3-cyclohexene-1-carboxylic-acid synthase [Azonexus sp.]